MNLRNTLFSLFLLISLGSPALAAGPITLRPAVEVRAGTVKLSDVFEGVPVDKDQEIANAPAPGKSVVYGVKVLSRLSEHFLLGWMPESLSDRCVLTRASTKLTPEMIGAKIVERIRANDSLASADMGVVFDGRFAGLALPIEQDPVFDLNAFEYNPQTRRFRAELVAGIGTAQPVRQRVSGRVSVRREIPVISRRIQAGATLSEGDLAWQTIPQEKLPEDAVTDLAEIVGREVRRDQNEGDVLRARDLIPPRLVMRGSLVTMKVESPLLQITAQGRALQDGAKGDVVRVTNLQSNRTIEGTVESSGVVRVGTTRKVALAK